MQAWKAWFNETNDDLTINVIGEFTSTPQSDFCLSLKYPSVLNTSILALEVVETKSSSTPVKQPRLVHFCCKVKEVMEFNQVQVFYNNEVIADIKNIEVVCQQAEAETTLL